MPSPLDTEIEGLLVTIANARRGLQLAAAHIESLDAENQTLRARVALLQPGALEAENAQLRARVVALEAQRKALGALGYLPPEPDDERAS